MYFTTSFTTFKRIRGFFVEVFLPTFFLCNHYKIILEIPSYRFWKIENPSFNTIREEWLESWRQQDRTTVVVQKETYPSLRWRFTLQHIHQLFIQSNATEAQSNDQIPSPSPWISPIRLLPNLNIQDKVSASPSSPPSLRYPLLHWKNGATLITFTVLKTSITFQILSMWQTKITNSPVQRANQTSPFIFCLNVGLNKIKFSSEFLSINSDFKHSSAIQMMFH